MQTVDQTRIAAHAMLSPKTVARAYAGERTHSTTRARIEQAAKALGLPLPPAQPTANRETA